MKKNFVLISLLLIAFCVQSAFSAEKVIYQDFELDKLIHDIEKPQAPVITDDYIIFTSDCDYRFVGIAFDFEDYQIIHPFQILTRKDDDNVKKRSLMFYTYERQHKFTKLKYRLVLDGLWTTDPHNPNKEFDEDTSLYFSKVEDVNSVKIYTQPTKKDTVHFIYKGKSGQRVNLSGNFSNWDPWIYQLTETKPGLYELDLPLPSGKYLYTYYIGFNQVLDTTNPERAYAPDGRSVNVIYVD